MKKLIIHHWAGYDFYEAHWIPLFKKLGWIKEVKEVEPLNI